MDFSTIQGHVANWLNRDDLADSIPLFINMAMKHFERSNNWRYMLTLNNTITPVDGVMSLPDDYKAAESLHIIANGGRTLLDRDSYSNVYRRYPSDAKGLPKCWTQFGAWSDLIIRPLPDSDDYEYELQYYAWTPDLSGSTDTNYITNNYSDMLLYGALLQAAPFIGDDSRLAIWSEAYMAVIGQIKKFEGNEAISGSPQKLSASVGDIV